MMMMMRHVPSQVPSVSLLEAALSYAEVQHWPVFPLTKAGKRPLTPRGFYAATTDVETIMGWWRRWPEANIGLPTGVQTGLVVLDVDPRHNGSASLAALQRRYAPLPTTRSTQTGGGGWHYWFEYPLAGRNHAIGNATKLGGFCGIDLRGTGGYVVVPPSRHESGQHYHWLREEVPLAPLPDFLLALACPRAHHILPSSTAANKGGEIAMQRNVGRPMSMPMGKSGGYWLEQAITKAQPGTRNATGFWLACQLRDDEVNFHEATNLLQQYAAAVSSRGSAPYTEREALRSLSSAYNRPPRPPALRRFNS